MKAPEITLDEIRARVRARFERLHAHLLRELGAQRDRLAYDKEGDTQISLLEPAREKYAKYTSGRELTPDQKERAVDTLTVPFFSYHATVLPWADEPGSAPERLTIGEALDLLAAEGEGIVERTAHDIHESVLQFEKVPDALRQAVLARPELVARWPWPRKTLGPEMFGSQDAAVAPYAPGIALSLLVVLSPTTPAGEPLPGAWPSEISPADFLRWMGGPAAPNESFTDVLALALVFSRPSVLYSVVRAVERDQCRQAVAIDAGKAHHDLLEGWRDLPKDTRKDTIREPHSGRIELLAPGRCVQLALDLGPSTLSEAMTLALRDLRSWSGLRNWAALQRLFSVEGGRQGMVRWTLDGHLEALGYSPQERTRAPVRSKIAREVEAFTHLELAAYDQHGKLRERRPLVMVGSRFERLQGSEWRLDGMELQINPLLYRGVREEGGELGSNWHPAPVELARMDHVRHPYAYSLGLILPIRWRLALAEGLDHLHYTGESLLRLAGIKYSRHDPGKAWGALERDLEELHRIGHVGRWEWVDAPRTLAGMMDLYPAEWMLDRTLRGVRPVELPPGPPVLTGGELKAWRKARGLTQARAAEVLGVRKITILRAEKRPEGQLSPYLADRLKATQ